MRIRPATALGILLGIGFVAGTAPSARAQTYLSAYTGGSWTRGSDLRVRLPGGGGQGTDAVFHGVTWSGRSLEMPLYYGWQVGGFRGPDAHWGVEVDFTHYKVYANVDRVVSVSGQWGGVPLSGSLRLDDHVQRFAISHGVNILALNVLYRWQMQPSPSFPYGRVAPFVGGGPALYILHPENMIDGRANRERYETSGVGWQVVAGVRYGLTPRLSLLGAVKFDRGDAKVGTADGGTADTDLHTWHTQIGFSYRL